MLDKAKAAVSCVWADLVHGEHRWCFRGVLAAGVLVGWALGASVC